MRTLKENLLKNVGVGKTGLITRWIDQNATFYNGSYVVNDDYTIDIKGYIQFNGDFEKFPEYIQFGTIDGDFSINSVKSLVSLRGCPKVINGSFECLNCPELVSLEGCPEFIKIHMDLYNCTGLKSLKGCPKKVCDFSCQGCSSLKNLKGCPRVVSEFDCSDCNGLTDLEGSPREVYGSFNCSHCNHLTSLRGCSKKIAMRLNCGYCSELKSFEGAPSEILWDVYCDHCPKLTLNEFPRLIHMDVCCAESPFKEEDIRKVCDVRGEVWEGE